MNVFIVCSVFSLRMYSCLGKGECDVTAMSHVTAKVSCDGAANYRWTVDQLSLDSWPTIVGRWTFGQRLLDSWPTSVGHLAKSGDLDKYI